MIPNHPWHGRGGAWVEVHGKGATDRIGGFSGGFELWRCSRSTGLQRWDNGEVVVALMWERGDLGRDIAVQLYDGDIGIGSLRTGERESELDFFPLADSNAHDDAQAHHGRGQNRPGYFPH